MIVWLMVVIVSAGGRTEHVTRIESMERCEQAREAVLVSSRQFYGDRADVTAACFVTAAGRNP